MDDMRIYTDENGRIVRLEDPATRQRINFYGKERLGKITGIGIAGLTLEQLKDLYKNYYVMMVKDGKIVAMTETAKVKALKMRYASYLSGNSNIKNKIEEKYGVSVGVLEGG